MPGDSTSPEGACPPPSEESEYSSLALFLLSTAFSVAITTYVARRRRQQATAEPQAARTAPDTPQALCALARQWIAADPDPETRTRVSELLSSLLPGSGAKSSSSEKRNLLDALDPATARKRLRFGTAGVRMTVGPGYDKLNALTVIAVAQAVATVARPAKKLIVVAHDARHTSRRFALLIAQVFHHAGAEIHLYAKPVATPVAAHYGAVMDAAVTFVVTASHNPPQYNGIKVYWGDGMQIRSNVAKEIEECIPRSLNPWAKFSVSEESVVDYVYDPYEQSTAAFIEQVVPVVRRRSKQQNAKAPRVVYTSCHGVGYEFIKHIFDEFGLPPVFPTPGQTEPDPKFPTLPFPNPEEKGVFDLAIAEARSRNVRLVFANDPDADRFAIVEIQDDDSIRRFDGNEIAALLADYMTTVFDEQPLDLSSYAVVASLVSSKIIASMARSRGFTFREAMTGFKWLSKEAVDLEAKGMTPILTYEEAIGFNVTRNVVRDKDGISAAAMFAELAGYLYENGKSVAKRYEELIEECGVHLSHNGYLRQTEKSPTTEQIFEAARAAGLPGQLGRASVHSFRDMTKAIDTAEEGNVSRFPPDATTQFITFRCKLDSSRDDHCSLIIHFRGSGTEPKIKFYSELRCSKAEAEDGSAELTLKTAVNDAINKVLLPESHHLTR